MKRKLAQAIRILGGQTKAAKLLKVTQPAVHYWLNESERGLPAEYCATVERATNGKVTAAQLRPDLFGASA